MLWAGDTRVRILQNVESYGGAVAMVSITAPGQDRLPWGDDGRIERRARVRWNSAAPENWRRLHRAASQRARRAGHKLTVLCWVWEYQRRGALHKHVLLGVETAAELAGAIEYVDGLDRLRHAHDFGFVDRGRRRRGEGRRLEVRGAQHAGRYVAKYLAKRVDGVMVLSETVMAEDVPPLVAYVSRALTGETGVTMRALRWRRHVHVLGFDPHTGEVWASFHLNELLRLIRAGVTVALVDEDPP